MNAFDVPVDQLLQQWQEHMQLLFPNYIAPSDMEPNIEEWLVPKQAPTTLSNANISGEHLTTKLKFGPRDYRTNEIDEAHRLPVSMMCDYRTMMERQPPRLRFVNEEDEMLDKLLAFGNPYKRLTVRWTADEMTTSEKAPDSASATVQLDDGRQSELEQEAIVTALNTADENVLPTAFDTSAVNTTILLRRAHPRRRIRPHDPSKLHPRVLKALKELNIYVPPPPPLPLLASDGSVALVQPAPPVTISASSDSGYDSTASSAGEDAMRIRKREAGADETETSGKSDDVKRVKVVSDSDILKSLSSLIKKPGKSSAKLLLDRLRELQIPVDSKCRLIKELTSEAKRFKKQSLVDELAAMLGLLNSS
jgi:hypothetical protein